MISRNHRCACVSFSSRIANSKRHAASRIGDMAMWLTAFAWNFALPGEPPENPEWLFDGTRITLSPTYFI
jgi:hypothetical protein